MNIQRQIAIPFKDATRRSGEIVLRDAWNQWHTSEPSFQEPEIAPLFEQTVVQPDFSEFDQVSRVPADFTELKLTSRVPEKDRNVVTGNLVQILGSFLIGISASLLIYLILPFVALELRQRVITFTNQWTPMADTLVQVEFPDHVQQISKPDVTPVQEEIFQLQIPSLKIDVGVSANVDAGNPAEYEQVLKSSIAHAKGTGFPDHDGGISKTIFLFAHSTNGSWNITQYNAQFYALKDIQQGDEISVWFWGKKFVYQVEGIEIVEPEDLTILEPQLEEEKLVLQTCWPPGTTETRLLVMASR